MASTELNEEDILLGQRIISAASRLDNDALKVLLKNGGSANVRNENRKAPLHAAISTGTKENEAQVVKTVNLLLENGAIWNDVNKDDETPGCIALRLDLKAVYAAMVEAGVRAELLFNAMGEMFGDGDESEEDEDDVEILDVEDANIVDAGDQLQQESLSEETETRTTEPIQEETMQDTTNDDDWYDVSASNFSYLNSTLRYKKDILLDSSNNAVMMSWETEIMTRHAETLLPTPGLRALNVGHGMGIVDGQIQARSPAEHHIIEAHPQVLQRLRETGWYEKPGVTIWEGRWQDVIPKMIEKGVVLDAVYYDTFAEDYAAFKDFVDKVVLPLLDSKGKFGWYNGLGADRQICYDIYTKVAEMDLYEFGFDTVWEDIRVPADLHGHKDWEGTRRPYWTIDVYRLPINTFVK